MTATQSEVHLKSLFKNKLERTQIITGTTELVYNEALKFLPDNRIEDFKESWVNTKLDKIFLRPVMQQGRASLKIPNLLEKENAAMKKIKKITTPKKNLGEKKPQTNIFGYRQPSEMLAERIRMTNTPLDRLAKFMEFKDVSMISKQMRGERDITREQAFRYADFFGCAPQDILFAPPVVPIWAHVDWLRVSNADLPYNAGELIPQAGKANVVCPADIYRPDVKAVKVNSPGSSLDGHVLFYYASASVNQDCVGRLSIVGEASEDDDLMQEIRGGMDKRYFVGIYENYRGKTRIINPDVFAKDTMTKESQGSEIVIKDIVPSFAAPIVAIVNPGMIRKDKLASELFKWHDQVYTQQRMLEEQKRKYTQMLGIEKRKIEIEKQKMTQTQKALAKDMEQQSNNIAKQIKELEKAIILEYESKKSPFFFGRTRHKGLLDDLSEIETDTKIKLEKEIKESLHKKLA